MYFLEFPLYFQCDLSLMKIIINVFGGFWRSVCHHDSPLAAPHLGKVLTGERGGGLGLVDLVHALVGVGVGEGHVK